MVARRKHTSGTTTCAYKAAVPWYATLLPSPFFHSPRHSQYSQLLKYTLSSNHVDPRISPRLPLPPPHHRIIISMSPHHRPLRGPSPSSSSPRNQPLSFFMDPSPHNLLLRSLVHDLRLQRPIPLFPKPTIRPLTHQPLSPRGTSERPDILPTSFQRHYLHFLWN